MNLFLPTIRPEGWPNVPPWGNLAADAVRYVADLYGDMRYLAMLLESESGHKWHLLTCDGKAFASGAGWKNCDSLDYRKSAATCVAID